MGEDSARNDFVGRFSNSGLLVLKVWCSRKIMIILQVLPIFTINGDKSVVNNRVLYIKWSDIK